MIIEKIKALLKIREEFRILAERPFNRIYASESLVVKIAELEGFGWQIGKFSRERAFFDFIRNNLPGVKVPEIILVDESKKFVPREFIVMSRIKGIPLWEVIKQDKRCDETIREVGRAIAEIHSIVPNSESYGLLNSGQHKSWFSYLDTNIHLVNKYPTRLKKPELLSRAEKIIREKLQKRETTKSLLHNDLNLGNFLINPGDLSLTGIIDGEVACIGDPMYDLGRFNLYTPQEEIIERFKEGYSAIREICEQDIYLYTLVTGLEMSYLFANNNKRIMAFNKKMEESLNKLKR